jgi:hypothetical protein
MHVTAAARKQPRKLKAICDDLPLILRTLSEQPHGMF